MHKRFTKLAILFAAVLITNTVLAAPIVLTINWDAPTLKADCSPFPANQLQGYRLYILNMFNGKTLQIGQSASVPTSYKATLDDKTWYLFYIRAIDTNNQISAPSQVVEFNGTTTTVAIPFKSNCL